MKKIVVVGGGTGTYTVLKGLKKYAHECDISAIVTMADSGGSTGRLRDEFGQLPVGDVRMALVALAPEVDTSDELLRALFLYRFDRGAGLAGHNFGNLFLTALTDILGSSRLAINAAAQLLRITGEVLPVTTDNVHLEATYENGEVSIGEHLIDTPPSHLHVARIQSLRVVPNAVIDPAARTALTEADIIVFGPGDLYTSVLAPTVVDGFTDAVRDSQAVIIYIANLMSRPGQTVGMQVEEHVREVAKYVGRSPDHVLVNTTPLPIDILARYESEGTYPVVNDCMSGNYHIMATDFLASERITKVAGDILTRSLIRHDPAKLAAAIHRIMFSATKDTLL